MVYAEQLIKSNGGRYKPGANMIFGDRTIVGEQLNVDGISISGRTFRPGDLVIELSREPSGIMLYVNVADTNVFEQGPFADEPAGLKAYGEFKGRARSSRMEISDDKLNIMPKEEKTEEG